MLESVGRRTATRTSSSTFHKVDPWERRWIPRMILVSLLALLWISSCHEALAFLQQPAFRSHHREASSSATVTSRTTALLATRRNSKVATASDNRNVSTSTDDNDDSTAFTVVDALHGHDLIYSDPNPSSMSLSWMLRFEDNARKLEEQVRQLTLAVQALHHTVNNTDLTHRRTESSSSNDPSSSSSLTRPISNTQQRTPNKKRAQLLIDGTWLYYSLYQRSGEGSCPISRVYGRDWVSNYELDFSRIPHILQSHFQNQFQLDIDVEACVVFTSSKADTAHHSWRYKMFQQMKASGFHVHMMETLGRAEKCVDIALAVELLHVDCDIALLLTGDKDFLPALVRARTPSKQVGLVSMRPSCNRALFEPPPGAIMDYSVVWLDEYLDQFVVRNDAFDDPDNEEDKLSRFTIIKILNDFIEQSGVKRVSSRDTGRYLKSLRTETSSILEIIKRSFGSLRQMLRLLPDVYEVIDLDGEDKLHFSDRSFVIAMTDTAKDRLQVEAQRAVLTATEKRFFDRYSLKPLQYKTLSYANTLRLVNDVPNLSHKSPSDTTPIAQTYTGEPPATPPVNEATSDYTTFTVVQLKEVCRERKLPVTGTKSVLLERISEDMKQHRPVLESQGLNKFGDSSFYSDQWNAPNDTTKYLVDLIAEYLQAKGGKASSRDVGRYLAVNRASKGDGRISALTELKAQFGSVGQFIQKVPAILERENAGDPGEDYEFVVRLKERALEI